MMVKDARSNQGNKGRCGDCSMMDCYDLLLLYLSVPVWTKDTHSQNGTA